MLQRKYRGRHKHCHLLAVSHSLECRPDCNFRLSESDIPAHKPVHRAVILHVMLYGPYCLLLVRRILIHERRLKLFLHIRIRGKGKAFCSLSLGIELNEFLCYVLDLGLGAVLEILPCPGAQLVDFRRLGIL